MLINFLGATNDVNHYTNPPCRRGITGGKWSVVPDFIIVHSAHSSSLRAVVTSPPQCVHHNTVFLVTSATYDALVPCVRPLGQLGSNYDQQEIEEFG